MGGDQFDCYKDGCTTETLRRCIRQAEHDEGKRAGLTTGERERLKQLERENLERQQQQMPGRTSPSL